MAFINNWEAKGVYKVFSGDVTGQEVLDSVIEIEEDRRFDQIQYVLNDFLAVNGVQASERDIALVAAIDRAASKSNPDIKIAVVATQQKIIELAQHYSRLIEDSPFQTQLFASVEDARNWLA